MREALLRIYDAMPAPKWVVAVGECAACGGLLAESYACEGGAAAVLPVDLNISGCPPAPARLLEGLLALMTPAKAKGFAPLTPPKASLWKHSWGGGVDTAMPERVLPCR